MILTTIFAVYVALVPDSYFLSGDWLAKYRAVAAKAGFAEAALRDTLDPAAYETVAFDCYPHRIVVRGVPPDAEPLGRVRKVAVIERGHKDFAPLCRVLDALFKRGVP